MAPVQRLHDLTTSYVQRARARAYFELAISKAMTGDGSFYRGPERELVTRATVGAQTTDALAAARILSGAFLETVSPKTVLGAMAGAVRAVPPNVQLPAATAPATAYWHAEGKADPIAKFTTGVLTLGTHSLTSLVAFAKELLRRGGPAAMGLAEREMQNAIIVAGDGALLDAAAAIAGQRPASILYGLSSIGGGSPWDTEADLTALWLTVAGGAPEAPFFITSPTGAVYLAGLRTNGTRLFPDVTAVGGSLRGVRVLVSPAALSKLVLVDASALLVADEGVELDDSRTASVELDSAPGMDGTIGLGAATVSAFQAGLIVLRAQRFLDWTLGRSDGAGFITLPV